MEETYNEYKKQRLKVKDLVVNAKKETWKEFVEKIESNKKDNQKLFYKVLRNLRKGTQIVLKQINHKKEFVDKV